MKSKIFNIVRNILAVLGIIFLGLLSWQQIQAMHGRALNASSAEFMRQAVPAVFTDWNMDAFKARTDPLLFKYTSEDAMKKLFVRFSALGKLQEVQGCTGQAGETVLENKKVIAANYVCQIKFEKDTANIKLDLLRNDSQEWKIVGINLTSNYIAGLK